MYRSLRADGTVSSERALRASSRGVEGEDGEEEDSPSMTLNLPNDVHGGTQGYPIPMSLPDDSPGQVSVWIRYFYQGTSLYMRWQVSLYAEGVACRLLYMRNALA